MSGEPPWVDNDRYDVQAKVDSEDLAEWQRLNGDSKRKALQQFLAQYLKFQSHPDKSNHPHYELAVATAGFKLKAAQQGDTLATASGKSLSARGLCHYMGRDSELDGEPCSMKQLAEALGRHADLPIIDKTGLTGSYLFALQFPPMPIPGATEGKEYEMLILPRPLATQSMVLAVKQLGLELRYTDGPLEGIVVDHIEKPPKN